MIAGGKVPAVFQETEMVELKLDCTESLRKDTPAYSTARSRTTDDGQNRLRKKEHKDAWIMKKITAALLNYFNNQINEHVSPKPQ